MFNQQQISYNIDIVMCIDVTGSMQPIIDKVKANALNFYENFMIEMDAHGKRKDQVRIKVIAFGDYECDEKPMEESRFFNLTVPEENTEFRNFVNGLEANGGGDLEENGLEAIAKAIQSDWTATGSKRRHVILLFTDAGALELQKRSGCPKYPSDMPRNLAELADWWSGLVPVGSFDATNSERFVLFAPNASPWDEIAMWDNTWHVASNAADGCSEVDFQQAYKLLVNSVSTTSTPQQ